MKDNATESDDGPLLTKAEFQKRVAQIAAVPRDDRPPEIVKLAEDAKRAKLGYTRADIQRIIAKKDRDKAQEAAADEDTGQGAGFTAATIEEFLKDGIVEIIETGAGEPTVRALCNEFYAELVKANPKVGKWILKKEFDKLVSAALASKTKLKAEAQAAKAGAPETLRKGDHRAAARLYRDTHHKDPSAVATVTYWRGEFYTWSAGLWIRSPMDHKDEDAILFGIAAWLDSIWLEDAEGRPEKNLPDQRQIHEVRKALAGTVTYYGEDNAWRSKPGKDGLIPVLNGLLNPDAQTLAPHDPRYFNTTRINANWRDDLTDDAAFAKAWAASETRSFLDAIFAEDPEQIVALQEFVGYVLGGSSEKQKGAIITGRKRSGKGTINLMLGHLLGSAACAPSTRDLTEDKFGMQDLLPARLATITDARIGPRTDFSALAEILLAVIGGDPRMIKRKFMTALSAVILRVIFLVLSNDVPGFRDDQGVLASRFVYFETTGSWFGIEDTELLAKLIAEADLWIAWAIRGLLTLRAKGPGGQFHETETHRRLYAQAQSKMSPVPSFLAAHVEATSNPDDFIDTDALFAIFLRWAQNFGLGTIGKIGFMRALTYRLKEVRVEKRTLDDLYLDERGALCGMRKRKKAVIGLRWKQGMAPTNLEIATAIDAHLPKETPVVVVEA